MYRLITIFSIMLFSLSSFAEGEDEFDFELEFGIKQKSTLNNFPLQEIGSEELSNAAISDALGTTRASSSTEQGKPAYEEQGDIDDKRKKEELKISSGKLNEDDFLRNSLIPQAPQLPQQVFQPDLGRTMNNNNTAFERP